MKSPGKEERRRPGKSKGERVRKGPRELDPALRRETITLPAPDPKALFCPESRRLRQPAFAEYLEVLARRPAEYYVKVYERTVFTSSAKTAPVATAWPADVLPRARMHASVVAHVACAHYADHVPFHRLEQQLERIGVNLPRSTQVSLMDQLARIVEPMVDYLCRTIMAEGYVQLDATPMGVADPAHPGKLKEAALWAYRGVKSGAVWFGYQPTKAVRGPDGVLRQHGYVGLLQTDAAAGLNNIGPHGQIRHLGCFAHLRRPFFHAVSGRERRAERYLAAINQLFEVERRAQEAGLGGEQRQKLRRRESVPRFHEMVAWARVEVLTAPPKTEWSDGLLYLLNHHASLERCLTKSLAELSNNGAENAIRPLKLGEKNWQAIGHPSAGPRLAKLFTLVENCRQAGIDPEAYLIDLIGRLPDHPAKDIAALSPWQWRPAPAGATTAAAASGSSPVR